MIGLIVGLVYLKEKKTRFLPVVREVGLPRSLGFA